MNKLLELDAENRQLLNGYKQEALEVLSDIDELKERLKEIVETASESVNIKKSYINKFFKSVHAGKTQEIITEGQIIEFLKDGEVTNE